MKQLVKEKRIIVVDNNNIGSHKTNGSKKGAREKNDSL